jgi:hypothetical protein
MIPGANMDLEELALTKGRCYLSRRDIVEAYGHLDLWGVVVGDKFYGDMTWEAAVKLAEGLAETEQATPVVALLIKGFEHTVKEEK